MDKGVLAEFLTELRLCVSKAEVSHETISWGGESTYNIMEQIAKAKQLCEEILRG